MKCRVLEFYLKSSFQIYSINIEHQKISTQACRPGPVLKHFTSNNNYDNMSIFSIDRH